MAHDLVIPVTADKAEKYRVLIKQLQSLTEGETDPVANTGNIMAALKETFGFLWVGCYWVRNTELVLGSFQGPVACTRIGMGKGVCGASWQQNEAVIVPDVDAFPGHIACSSRSRSEIVVPIRNGHGEVVGVLDVDSETVNHFDTTDEFFLNEVAVLISQLNPGV